MSDLIRPVPSEEENQWQISINGENKSDVRHIRASHSKFGALSWGKRPEGTQGWMWEEVGGGGAGIVAYVLVTEKLYIGLTLEQRFGVRGNWALNIPRGFVDPSISHLENARREWEEEVVCRSTFTL